MSTPDIATYPVHKEGIPDTVIDAGKYCARFVQDPAELDDVLRLRYQVFNLELNEGLDSSHASGKDEDPYDASCHHLVVCHRSTGAIVGTYRLQTRSMADAHRGFYSASEFDLSALPASFLDQAVELGRACIGRDHRNRRVLYLLWCGLLKYVLHNRKRYFFGCSSLTSQDPADAARMLSYLQQRGHMMPELDVAPMPAHRCLEEGDLPEPDGVVVVPRLMQLYLNYGARICGRPAIDRQFKTIDFFSVFDLERLDPQTRKMFEK